MQDAQVPLKCASCERPMDSPVCCQSCHTLYPVGTSEDHFRLFGIRPQYDLDPDDLHRRFLSISRNIHPDFFGGQSDEMQNLSLRLSARINEAYEVLRDPLLRAEYLLESAGGKSSADDKSVPGELLSEVMTLREAMAEAQFEGDEAALARMRTQVQVREAATLERIGALCRRLEEGTDEVRSALRRELNTMKYLRNLLGNV